MSWIGDRFRDARDRFNEIADRLRPEKKVEGKIVGDTAMPMAPRYKDDPALSETHDKMPNPDFLVSESKDKDIGAASKSEASMSSGSPSYLDTTGVKEGRGTISRSNSQEFDSIPSPPNKPLPEVPNKSQAAKGDDEKIPSPPNNPLPPVPSKVERELEAELRSINVEPVSGYKNQQATSKSNEYPAEMPDIVRRSYEEYSKNQPAKGDDEKTASSPPNKPLPPVPEKQSEGRPDAMTKLMDSYNERGGDAPSYPAPTPDEQKFENRTRATSNAMDGTERAPLERQNTDFKPMPVNSEEHERRSNAAALFDEAQKQSMEAKDTGPKNQEPARDFEADMAKAVEDLRKGKAVGPISDAKAQDAKSPSKSPQKAADSSKSQGRG